MKSLGKLFSILAVLSFTACASNSPRGEKEVSNEEKVRLLIELASANILENDPTHALISLNNASTLDASNPTVNYLYALAYAQKNESERAINSAKKALALNPDFTAAKNTLGRLLLDQNRYAESERYLKEAAEDLTFGQSYIAKTNLGILYYKKLNPAAAEKWLNSAIADGKDAACMANFYRGQIYLDRNDFAKAQRDFDKATHNRCSQFADSHLALAQTEIRMKEYKVARAKLIEINEMFPNSDASEKAKQYLKEIP